MNDTYTIKAVKKVPKEWDSQYGPMKTWLIQIEGNGEPVQLNKKADSPMPTIGDELYGHIEDTEYGQKFKSAPKPFAQAAKRDWQPRDDKAIQAQWAIGQGVQLYIAQRDVLERNDIDINDIDFIEAQAKQFYAMIDRVKNSGGSE